MLEKVRNIQRPRLKDSPSTGCCDLTRTSRERNKNTVPTARSKLTFKPAIDSSALVKKILEGQFRIQSRVPVCLGISFLQTQE